MPGEPNINAVIIAFFSVVNTAILAYVAYRSSRTGSELHRNTVQTVRAKHAAQKAVEQTDHSKEDRIAVIVRRVIAEDSAVMKGIGGHHAEAPKTDPSYSRGSAGDSAVSH